MSDTSDVCEDCNRLVDEKQDLRSALAGLRDAGRQAYRQIGLFLEDGQRERLIVAQAILDPIGLEDREQAVVCPACGSNEHDGWNNHDGCPEDWTVLSKFEVRRGIQLICEPRCSEHCGDLRHPDGCEPVGPNDEYRGQ